MLEKLYFRKIWVIYFFVKLFYMIFAIFIFSKLTTLGDTFDYLHTPLYFSSRVFYSSTDMMQFTGALCRLIFRTDVLACLPFMLLSFYGIYYAVDRLDLYRYSTYIIILFSLPNFGVWTSILGKEAVGCFFSAVIAVMVIKNVYGTYQLKMVDYIAFYLCLVFKPQYLIFILQAFVFLRVSKIFTDKKYFPLFFGIAILAVNIGALYYFRDLIDSLAKGMAIHFRSTDPNLAHSTRSEAPWLAPYGFFHAAPYGMFIAFFGPTFSEMLNKPAQLIAGLESFAMIVCFGLLSLQRARYTLGNLRFNPVVLMSYFIIFAGILFIHYPFGFLNPGSAIRYRSNFYALFVLLLLYLFASHAGRKVKNNSHELTSI